jgi:hypothetical protein
MWVSADIASVKEPVLIMKYDVGLTKSAWDWGELYQQDAALLLMV